MESDTVRLCIGGSVFLTTEKTLSKYPETRLANLNTSSSHYDKTNNWYYFDRDDEAFKSILNFYRTSELHVPNHICARAFSRELEFWNVPETMVSNCCWRSMYQIEKDRKLLKMLNHEPDRCGVMLSGTKSKCGQWRHRFCQFLEQPNSSKEAKLFNLFLMLVIAVSAVVACLESVSELRDHFHFDPDDPSLDVTEQQELRELQSYIANMTNVKLRLLLYSTQNRGLYYTDVFCLVVLSVELVVRFSVCPFKLAFFKRLSSWVDVVSVVTGVCIYLYEFAYENDWVPDTETAFFPYFVFRCLYVVRLFRFFRLSQRFDGLRIMILSLKLSSKELLLLVMTYLILATMFGSVEYYCEFHNNRFSNMPIAIWWAIITMTTVGYGDYVPSGLCGYVVGSMCSLCGLIIIAMPIAVVASNFNSLYSQHLSKKHHKRKDSEKLNESQKKNIAEHTDTRN